MPAYSKLSPEDAAAKKFRSSSGPGKKLQKRERLAAMNHFLRAYATTGLRYKASHEAGVSSKTIRDWEVKYPNFADRVQDCELIFIEGMEVIGIRRAKRKSDALMITFLKAYHPKKYNPKLEAKLDVGAASVTVIFSPDELSDRDTEASTRAPKPKS